MKKIPLFYTNDEALDRGAAPKIHWLECKKYEKRESERPVKPTNEKLLKKNFHYAKKYQRKEEELMSVDVECDDGEGSGEGSDLDEERTWLVLPAGLSEEDMLDVYTRFPSKLTFDPQLPITAYQSQIMDSIERNKVTLVEGGTGTGKSTQVAQFIYDHCFNHNKYCNVVVTQPRKIAAISLARRVCSENGWDLGSVCGYQVGMDKVMSEDGRLLYCTTGVLLQLLISNKHMNRFTHVILDEIHERSQEMDFCMLVVRKFLRTVSPHVKVILMSATMEVDTYLEYFKYKDRRGVIRPPQHVHVDAGAFHVDEVYLDELRHLGEIPKEITMEEPYVSDQLLQLALSLILSFDDAQMGDDWGDGRGSVLVFLPGYEHIIDMQNKLNQYTKTHKLVIHILHSLISASEQISVFSPVAYGYRKIILSTNIAESSITVADIKYVIDFCLTKTIHCEVSTSHTSLQLQWASKSSCTQRKGRAGRVANGIVFRMVKEDFYQQLPDFNTPEILRCSLEQLVLKAKLLDMGKPKAILAIALTPPDLRKIRSTVFLLKEQGALNPRSRDPLDGELTFVGRVMGGLPLDTRLTRLILLSHVFGLLDEGVIIAALLSLPSIFIFSHKFKLNSYMTKLKWAKNTHCDSLASFQAYLAWEHLDNIGSFRTFKDQVVWCNNNFLDAKRLKEAKMLVDELLNRLNTFSIRPTSQHKPINLELPHNQLLMKVLLSGAAYPNFLQYSSYDEKDKTKQLCNFSHLSTVFVKGLPEGGGRYYKKDLLNIFSKLVPATSSIKLHFVNTRCFIEFQNEQDSVSIAVNAAIKMRMLKENLVVSYQNVYEQSSSRGNRHTEAIPPVPRNDETTNGGIQALMPPPGTNRVLLNITEIVDCACFYATFATTLPLKWSLHEDMQQWILQNPSLRLQNARHGMHCLAEFHDGGDLAFYRARILLIRPDLTATVFFIDYGNRSNLRVCDLRPIPPCFLNQPAQAVRCELVNVQANRLSNPDGRWSALDKKAFEDLFNLEELYMADIYSAVEGTMRVDLWEQKDSMPGRNINKILLRSGVAEWMEESVASQDNHRERQLRAAQATNPQQQHNNNSNYQSGKLVVQDSEVVLNLQTNPSLRTVRLTGPYNPFEIDFTAVGNTNSPRLISIDPQSVNSVHVIKDPAESSPLMIAMWVSLNPAHSRLLVRNTSILPCIPGLMPLLALLFCPFAEYRLSDDKRRIIGALCGLGGSSTQQQQQADKQQQQVPEGVESLFEANDMEVELDVKMDEEDMRLINDLRMSIDLVIGRQMDWSVANLLQIQEDNRHKLERLLNKEREKMDKEFFREPYKWGQFRTEDCQDTQTYNNLLDTATIFFPHNMVSLQQSNRNASRNQMVIDRFGDEDLRINAGRHPSKRVHGY